MQFNAKKQVVLICRSEIEKTPKTVYGHEVSVLEFIHGHARIETTDIPTEDVELDAEVEFTRLLTEYSPRGDAADPVIGVFRNFDGFMAEVSPEDDKPRRGRPAKAE